MSTALSRILRTATRDPSEPLNIVTFSTHERTQSSMALTGDSYYALQGAGLKSWDHRFAPVPPNYHLLTGTDLPPNVVPDLVLSHTRGNQFQIAKLLSGKHGIPHINLAHTLPPEGQGQEVWRADYNVFITEYSRDAWGYTDDSSAVVIEHGVDTELFRPRDYARRPVVLAVANQFKSRDAELGYSFWDVATEAYPRMVVGDNPGLSEPARSLDRLAYFYQTSAVFVNTASRSPVPTVLLEAMACGCAVISTRNPMVESIIRDGENGYLVDSPAAMSRRIGELLENPETAVTVGQKATVTIQERFGMSRYIENWVSLFRHAAASLHRGVTK